MGLAKSLGTGLGAIANNPGVIIIGLALGALFLFRKDIRGAFEGIGQAAIDIKLPDFPSITLPEIKFPEFPTIVLPEFPTFDFPDFGSLFTGFQKQIDDISGQVFKLGETVGMFGPDTTITKEGVIEGAPPTVATVTDDLSTFFGEQRPKVFDTLIQAFGLTPAQAFGELKGAETIEDLNEVLQRLNQEAVSMVQTPGVTPPQVFPVQSEIPGQQFFGGGVSFIGGAVGETPIEFLTLNQIIEMGLASSASEASALRREAQGFPSAETGFVPEQFFTQQLQGGPPGIDLPEFGGITGDPQFTGLTPEEIIRRILGGVITNF